MVSIARTLFPESNVPIWRMRNTRKSNSEVVNPMVMASLSGYPWTLSTSGPISRNIRTS